MMPSRSALMAAAARAAHLEVDHPPFLFEDVLARRLLGAQADELLSYHRQSGAHPLLMGTRLVVTSRARYAEERLTDVASRGITQYVILGAGLDSFAYRSTLAGESTVYEVDEQTTSEWKRQVLTTVGITVPAHVRFVPVNLGADALIHHLTKSGFDRDRPAFLSWLGVTMYLDQSAIARTLRQVAELAPGSELVFDHVLPASERDEAGAEYASLAESVGGANGEPWLSSLGVDEVAVMLAEAGLEAIAQPPLRGWLDASSWQRTDAIRPNHLWAMAHARVPGPSR